jgi:hypothetical protein
MRNGQHEEESVMASIKQADLQDLAIAYRVRAAVYWRAVSGCVAGAENYGGGGCFTHTVPVAGGNAFFGAHAN